MRRVFTVVLITTATLAVPLAAWGPTAHRVITRAAILNLPADVPSFLAREIDWIGVRAVVPDSWRAASEPFAKAEEDPNHTWYLEQFGFLKTVPRSRNEFILALYDENRRLLASNPAAATKMNVRWTGTLPYQTAEIYERLKVAFREWRAKKAANEETKFIELDAAFYAGWLSHYVADGAMPLHTSVHHDGWDGDNPKNYTSSGTIHWGFENDFVELTGLRDDDIRNRLNAPARVADVFSAMLAYLDRSHTRVEQVYQLEQRGAFKDRANAEARGLVLTCTSEAATMLRDLIYTAWLTSAERGTPIPAPPGFISPDSPSHPKYNPATGSAPAP